MYMSQHTLVFIALILLSACSDYQTGYTDGYDSKEQQQWIVFGRNDYVTGFHAGQAEKFQVDWLAENPLRDDIRYCPDFITTVDATYILPKGYSNIGLDMYSR